MTFSVDSTSTGIHSRSESTVKISRSFDRGRSQKSELDRVFEDDAADFVRLQIESGFTRISDGQIKWQDFLRPFSESLDGLRSGADLSRWYDTNSFYRKPSVAGKIKSSDGLFLENYLTRALKLVKSKTIKKKISIPGPYTLASLVAADKRRLDLVEDFAVVLRKIIESLPSLGFESVQINEPSLVYRYGESALTSKLHLSAFLDAFSNHLSKMPVEVYLHTYFGDSSKILKELLTLDGITALGIDFTQTALDDIETCKFGDKALACGCVDGRNSLVETPEWISKFCLESVRSLKPRGLVILPSCELKYLPRTYADRKIRAIGKAAAIAQRKLK
ncbi:MAG: hypothetical protein JRN15_01395 [Nitrososphaerota archaeon]|nr:hypothetical protein [Nitrososphaerota archaeon]